MSQLSCTYKSLRLKGNSRTRNLNYSIVSVRPKAYKHRSQIYSFSIRSGPDTDTEESRSPVDAPQEWEVPQPSKRPDIFPEFEKMERVFLPKPLPGDPELPDEESEEKRKRVEPGDPDPEAKPGEPAEPEEPEPSEPGREPEKKTDIPNIPD